MDLPSACRDAGGVFPARVPIYRGEVTHHAQCAGGGVVLVDYCVRCHCAVPAHSGAVCHHDALLPKAVYRHRRLPRCAQRALSALLWAGSRAGLPVLQL